eukprot:TRINITY_DN82625_c0_g1_i1.p1 TRINITY_DN82625_c0_g1~~TRINITY_DN82625_c0_g1_i1.p1  ORF type:complete len:866 (-),score=169.14 TRINITY_DN82625_c0_g1_i1:2-2569(-)
MVAHGRRARRKVANLDEEVEKSDTDFEDEEEEGEELEGEEDEEEEEDELEEATDDSDSDIDRLLPPGHRYEIIRKVDSGTYGDVYKAVDHQTHQTVALKRIRHSKQTVPQDVIREIANLTKVGRFPLIVELERVFVHGSAIYLVMAYHNRTLHDLEDLSVSDVKWYSFQLLLAADFLRSQGILHRDWKPNNVLINRDDDIIKLADFGQSVDISVPLVAANIATRDYRAPEVTMGDDHMDYKSEIWSIGCVIFFIYADGHLFDTECEIEYMRDAFAQFGVPFRADECNSLKQMRKWQKFAELFGCKRPPHLRLNALTKLLRKKEYIGKKRKFTWREDPDVCLLVDLLSRLLVVNPALRLSAAEALQHPFFKSIWHQLRTVPDAEPPGYIPQPVGVEPFPKPQLPLDRWQILRSCLDFSRYQHAEERNVNGMPFYASNIETYSITRRVFIEFTCKSIEIYPMALTTLLDGLDMLDHFASMMIEDAEIFAQASAILGDGNAGAPLSEAQWRVVAFTVIFIVHKYYSDLYHDLNRPSTTTASECSRSLPDLEQETPSEKQHGEEVAAAVVQEEAVAANASEEPAEHILDGEKPPAQEGHETPGELPAEVPPSTDPLPLQPKEQTEGPEDQPAEAEDVPPVFWPEKLPKAPTIPPYCDDGEESQWSTYSSTTLSTESSYSSSGGYTPREERLADRLALSLGVSMDDVEHFEQFFLGTIGIPFLSKSNRLREALRGGLSVPYSIPDPPPIPSNVKRGKKQDSTTELCFEEWHLLRQAFYMGLLSLLDESPAVRSVFHVVGEVSGLLGKCWLPPEVRRETAERVARLHATANLQSLLLPEEAESLVHLLKVPEEALLVVEEV